MIQFDCHAHVYETTRTVPGARYAPKAPAPLSSWLKNLENHKLKGGVIVQVSFLGTDNSELCAALGKLDTSRFAGVAVVPLDVGASELGRLKACGVRGVRWNLVGGAVIPDLKTAQVQAFLEKLRKHDLHLEVHLEGHRLAPHIAQLTDQGLKIVVDHFGLPSDASPESDPFIKAVTEQKNARNLYIKLSAPYRTQFDITNHLTRLRDVLSPEQTIWGSDWPHTQHENLVDFGSVFNDAIRWFCESDASSAGILYGIASN
jgi:predicted TIM-barrel fold metal-dependent hydrolase